MSASFPIPHPGQLPSDDLDSALLLLSAVGFSMENGKGLAPSKVQSLFSVLCAATEKLEVIQLFLESYKCPDESAQYQDARRSWVMQLGGEA